MLFPTSEIDLFVLFQLYTMDNFVVRNAADKSKKAVHVFLKDRARQFPGVLYEDGGKLFCKLCNQVVDDTRKLSIETHLQSAKHKRKRERALM